MNPIFEILPTDTRFADSPHDGDPNCFCSRCGNPIAEGVGAIRAWPESGVGYEYRFHPECLGFTVCPEVEDEEFAP